MQVNVKLAGTDNCFNSNKKERIKTDRRKSIHFRCEL